MENARSNHWLWPAVDAPEQALRAARKGMWAALFVAAATGFAASLALLANSRIAGVGSSAFVDAVLFGCVAWGIHRGSRIAAVSGLVLYLLERAYMWSQSVPGVGGLVIPFVLTASFVSGIRGTFARHRFNSGPKTSTPPVPSPIRPR